MRDTGMITAEYAVGMAGAVCISCVLMQLGIFGADTWITDVFDRLRELGGWLELRSIPGRALS